MVVENDSSAEKGSENSCADKVCVAYEEGRLMREPTRYEFILNTFSVTVMIASCGASYELCLRLATQVMFASCDASYESRSARR